MYSIDIYRTDDAILIHDKPGGWKRALPGLLFCLGCAVFLAWMSVGAALEGALIVGLVVGSIMGSCNVYFLLYILWRIDGHVTILIDRDSIRHDWWCFWGSRSRIYPRPENIKTETDPSPHGWLAGGSFGAVIRFRKRWWQTKYMYLPTAAERHWLFTELARFQEEVPTTQPIDDKKPVRKGSFTESECGMNMLETLDWRGQFFQRVIPKSESVPEEKTDRGTPGILSLRCARCHKIVPREHVLPDKPLAHCPDCGCVFEPQELKVRGESEEEQTALTPALSQRERGDICSRLQIRRSADSLEIIQRPLRTGMPLWTILLFILFDLGIVAFYFYMKQMLPDEIFSGMFHTTDNSEFHWIGFLNGLAILHLVLVLPLWAFFDWRTIRINRETLTITGRWLFIPWWKTVSRLHAKKASTGELFVLFRNLKLGYASRAVWIGCTTMDETQMLCGEINHFLYTIEPARLENVHDDAEPAFLGGTESFDPEIGLHCPDCGAKLSSESLDLPNGNVHCHSCNKTFPIENAVAYKIEVIADKQPESVALERTDDSLTMQYVPDAEKGMRYINIAACYFCLLWFVGVFAALMGILIHSMIIQDARIVVYTVFFAFGGPMCVFLYCVCNNDLKACYCDWTIHLDTNEARFELRCKKRRKTIVIPREKIIEAKTNDDAKSMFKKIRFGPFPEFLWCRDCIGGHFLLDDGTRHYLPLGSVDQRNVCDITNWMLAMFNGFLAEHPRSVGKME